MPLPLSISNVYAYTIHIGYLTPVLAHVDPLDVWSYG